METPDVHVMPVRPDEPEHEETEHCWCRPQLTADYTSEGGSKVWTHKELMSAMQSRELH